MELIPYDPDIAMKKTIWEVLLFLERMRTAVPLFDPGLQKRLDMSRLDAAKKELQTIVEYVMENDSRLVPQDPNRPA